MTGTTNRYGIYEVDYTKFGGLIFLSDFNTDNRGKNCYGGSPIANRIANDTICELQWKKNRKAREGNKYYGK